MLCWEVISVLQTADVLRQTERREKKCICYCQCDSTSIYVIESLKGSERERGRERINVKLIPQNILVLNTAHSLLCDRDVQRQGVSDAPIYNIIIHE